MTREILILTETELRAALSLDLRAVDAVEQAFRALAGGEVVMPPILSMALPQVNGEVDVKTAYVPGVAGFAVKVSPGFFDNPKLGLPSLNGLMILLSAQTGVVEAVFLDNGFLTDLRTAAAGAVAARHLAPETVETAGVIGAGVQARLQMQAAHLVRPFRRALVWARDHAKAQACAADLAVTLGIEAKAVDDAAALVAQSQLVVTTTPAREPVVDADWLHPGLHITAMGSDAPNKQELDPRIITAADRFIVDKVSQCLKQGELRPALDVGLIQESDRFDELGEVCARMKAGRTSETEITACDLTGTGLQDTAIADYASKLIQTKSLGTVISN